MGRKKKKSPFSLSLESDTIYSIVAVLLIMLGLLVIISFTGQGSVLARVNATLIQALGVSTVFLPFIFIASGLVLFRTKWQWTQPHVLLGTLLLLIGTLGFFKTGEVGADTHQNVAELFSTPGSYVFFAALLCIGLLIVFQTSLRDVLEQLHEKRHVLPAVPLPKKKTTTSSLFDDDDEEKKRFSLPSIDVPFKKKQMPDETDDDEVPEEELPEGPLVQSTEIPKLSLHPEIQSDADEAVAEGEHATGGEIIWDYPPLSLLDASSGGEADRGDVNKNADTIESVLQSFNIRAKIEEVNYGPSVTQYALSISQGTKLSKITSLSTDMALALAAPGGQVRIEAPIAGRSLVGIEVPNYSAQYVTLRHMLSSDVMKQHDSKLAVALGIDVAGKPKVVDIAKMPHVLIAGSTGSGKSVAVNTIMCSILYRATPTEVKFILVDPKRVELTGYNDIPHLLVPVIVDAKKVVSALKWATHEMDRRYKHLAEVGVRNIDSYNELAGHAAMSKIVIIIDELADVMLFAPSEVEESVTRIAQMARAVGIHLVLATQRPSVDVLTGLIKANIPTRIAFNVSSMTDSRVIIDGPGAEKLLGKGDMLYVPPDQAKPSRVQGTFVSDKEIQSLIQFIKDQGHPAQYEEDITQKFQSSGGKGSSAGGLDDKDELFDEVAVFIARAGKGSSSMIQRQFSVGYNRAARILDQMHAAGFVGPQEGSKPREVHATAIAEYVARQGEE